MPYTRGLTADQRERQEIHQIAESILTGLNEYRGRKNLTKKDFAEFIGVTPNTYGEWLRSGADKAQFSVLVRAAIRCGVSIDVRV